MFYPNTSLYVAMTESKGLEESEAMAMAEEGHSETKGSDMIPIAG